MSRTPARTHHRSGVGASDSDTSGAVTLRQVLRRHRRRLVWVACCRHLWVLASAAGTGSLVLMMARPDITSLVTLLAGAVATASVLAVVTAWARRPSLQATAAALDRRLRLDDRMVTALQFADQDDAVARLILRGAVDRLAGRTPGQVFPLEAPRYGRAMLSTVAVVAMVVLLNRAMAPRAGSVPGGGWFISAGPASPDTPVLEREVSATDGADSAAADLVPMPDADPAADTLPSTVSDARAAHTSDGPPGSARADDATSPATDTDRDTPTGDGDSGGDRAQARAGTDSRGASASAGDTAGPGQGGRGGAGSPDAAGTREVPGVGGVTGGTLTRAAALPPRPSLPPTPGYDARYRAARRQAETALAQERVPPHLRTHVRQYFDAIRPTGLP